MEKQIITDTEGRDFLMKTFKCSRMQVWKALHFKGQTDELRRIRILALKRGGELVGADAPVCETTHQEVENTMTQTWGDRVKLVLHKDNGMVKAYVDGALKRIVENPTIPELMMLQQEMALTAQSL